MTKITNFDELHEGMNLKEKIFDYFIDLTLGKKIDCGGSGAGYEVTINKFKTAPITMWEVNNQEVELYY